MNSFTDFLTATPEQMGVTSESLIRFLKKLEDIDIPMHSAIVMRHDKIIMETYYKPYDRNTLHRMFSITKSLVSLGIGLLEEDGKLSLDDQIIKYFPEKLPAEGVHPYIEAMTIRDMLRMASAHDKTTFKVMLIDDWVRTFFAVTPNHVPGTCFSYDTSSTHTLAALVEKLSGMELLNYLRSKFLDELDFSKDAYCMKDPVGVSMGGSGLMATPYDLLKIMYVIAHKGIYNGKQLLPANYLKEATTKQIDNYSKSATFEEMQGYGYQFWCTTHNGIVCYGMGGQLALYLPEKDLILITTADTQGRQGGVQLIYDAFWETVYPSLSDCPIMPDTSLNANTNEDTNVNVIDNATDNVTDNAADNISGSQESLANYVASRQLMYLHGADTSPIMPLINNKTFLLDNNKMGFTNITLSFDNIDTKKCTIGQIDYSNISGTHTLKFAIGTNFIQQFPFYNYKTAVSGTWCREDTFLIKAHLIDECIGNIFIQLIFKNDTVTMMMRKFEETMFQEFDGIVSGKMIK